MKAADQKEPQCCEWDAETCRDAASLHVNWRFDNGKRRDEHLCEYHAADVRERQRDSKEWLISACDANCPIIINNAVRATHEQKP
jgi:hypothetical protein